MLADPDKMLEGAAVRIQSLARGKLDRHRCMMSQSPPLVSHLSSFACLHPYSNSKPQPLDPNSPLLPAYAHTPSCTCMRWPSDDTVLTGLPNTTLINVTYHHPTRPSTRVHDIKLKREEKQHEMFEHTEQHHALEDQAHQQEEFGEEYTAAALKIQQRARGMNERKRHQKLKAQVENNCLGYRARIFFLCTLMPCTDRAQRSLRHRSRRKDTRAGALRQWRGAASCAAQNPLCCFL